MVTSGMLAGAARTVKTVAALVASRVVAVVVGGGASVEKGTAREEAVRVLGQALTTY
jgi:hypothetical protein